MFTLNQAKSVAVVVVMFWMTTLAQAAITGTMTWADISNTTPADQIKTPVTTNYWWPATWDYSWYGRQITSLNARLAETVQPLTTTVTGLDNTKTYEVFVQFVGIEGNTDWAVMAALAGGQKETYTSANSVNTGVQVFAIDAFHVYEHSLGSVSGVTSLGVDISQSPGKEAHFNGVSYQEVVPEPAAVSLLLLGLALAMRRRS